MVLNIQEKKERAHQIQTWLSENAAEWVPLVTEGAHGRGKDWSKASKMLRKAFKGVVESTAITHLRQAWKALGASTPLAEAPTVASNNGTAAAKKTRKSGGRNDERADFAREFLRTHRHLSNGVLKAACNKASIEAGHGEVPSATFSNVKREIEAEVEVAVVISKGQQLECIVEDGMVRFPEMLMPADLLPDYFAPQEMDVRDKLVVGKR